jgi:hypothetical protein
MVDPNVIHVDDIDLTKRNSASANQKKGMIPATLRVTTSIRCMGREVSSAQHIRSSSAMTTVVGLLQALIVRENRSPSPTIGLRNESAGRTRSGRGVWASHSSDGAPSMTRNRGRVHWDSAPFLFARIM